jgi:modulator of FtsH protease
MPPSLASLTLQLPTPGLIVTLVGYFGLLYAVHKPLRLHWPALLLG